MIVVTTVMQSKDEVWYFSWTVKSHHKKPLIYEKSYKHIIGANCEAVMADSLDHISISN